MEAVTATAPMTADEFFALPYEETWRWRQLIEGELVLCSPGWLHNCAQGAILFALERWSAGGVAQPGAAA
jgi:Uma2 family endonuclease